jgi:hypothetical protein
MKASDILFAKRLRVPVFNDVCRHRSGLDGSILEQTDNKEALKTSHDGGAQQRSLVLYIYIYSTYNLNF